MTVFSFNYTRDPLGEEERGGLNQYGFVENNPVIFIDPLGLVHWGTVLQGGLQVASGITMWSAAGSSAVASSGTAIPLSYALFTWGGLSIANGINTLMAGFNNKGSPEPIQVTIVQSTYESITGKAMSPAGLTATRSAYYSIDIVMACVSIHASWTTMTTTSVISPRYVTTPVEVPLTPGASVGVVLQRTTSHLTFYGQTAGAATQSTSIMLDYYGVWNSVYGLNDELINNMTYSK